ncbi:MAG: hypothetical protein HYV02_01205 [Deltaproteobacteria bacterium]|nr:hypothetical protein [Deltaproteobacteria bacterium]
MLATRAWNAGVVRQWEARHLITASRYFWNRRGGAARLAARDTPFTTDSLGRALSSLPLENPARRYYERLNPGLPTLSRKLAAAAPGSKFAWYAHEVDAADGVNTGSWFFGTPYPQLTVTRAARALAYLMAGHVELDYPGDYCTRAKSYCVDLSQPPDLGLTATLRDPERSPLTAYVNNRGVLTGDALWHAERVAVHLWDQAYQLFDLQDVAWQHYDLRVSSDLFAATLADMVRVWSDGVRERGGPLLATGVDTLLARLAETPGAALRNWQERQLQAAVAKLTADEAAQRTIVSAVMAYWDPLTLNGDAPYMARAKAIDAIGWSGTIPLALLKSNAPMTYARFLAWNAEHPRETLTGRDFYNGCIADTVRDRWSVDRLKASAQRLVNAWYARYERQHERLEG